MKFLEGKIHFTIFRYRHSGTRLANSQQNRVRNLRIKSLPLALFYPQP
ncbi:MAG: hypothetical protein JRH18_00795 [Deltaproteobacteria bacterium]|nr:hypothetical protein [Deltaproteobacteria bacterium]MBW1959956.1 hypothetical protein [Deltaproteobacteria bacterium]MBW1994123.1 hypothetical protein [Deltaproteobacteria bacterium]MBW2150184.1 hypothetical protein [Deltaproteobacteria bacterium]